MNEPVEDRLLPSQKKELYDLLGTVGIDQGEFRYEWRRNGGIWGPPMDTIVHGPTGFYFGLRPTKLGNGFFVTRWPPGGKPLYKDWENVLTNGATDWVLAIERELSVGDPWEQAEGLASAAHEISDAPLSSEERRDFHKSLERLRAQLLSDLRTTQSTEAELTGASLDERVAAVEKELEYLKSRSSRLSKRDLAYIFASWSVNLATTLSLEPEKRNHLFELCRNILGQLRDTFVAILPR